MEISQEVPGTIYPNPACYWWKVRLPGDKEISQIALKPKGSKFATKNKKLAEILASEIWQDHIRSQKAIVWDGYLVTLIIKYTGYAKGYYLPPSRMVEEVESSLKPLAKYFPQILVDDFTPLHLKDYRSHIIANPEKFNWCRKTINNRINLVRRMFKWAASEMLVSIHTYTALTTVEGLRMGRTVAREGKKRPPAPSTAVNAVIKHATPIIADMIRIQLLTGMRPTELLIMRPGNIDRTKKVWVYIPTTLDPSKYAHKTEYLGHIRQIAIGPKAQSILNKYLLRKPDNYCFTPEESMLQSLKRKHANRKTPMSSGNKPGSNNKGVQEFNPCFDRNSYRKHITRVCKAIGVTVWSPYQLRHSKATAIRDDNQFVPDDILATLGQKSASMIDVYAELSFERAKKVALLTG